MRMLSHLWLQIPSLLPLALIVLLGSGPASASDSDLQGLPRIDFGCITCHAGAGSDVDSVPGGSAAFQMNSFGDAWLQGERVWAKALADGNADGDGCSNGFELGDSSGEWTIEDPRPDVDPSMLTQPGLSGDCTLPIDEESWGVLKSLFGE